MSHRASEPCASAASAPSDGSRLMTWSISTIRQVSVARDANTMQTSFSLQRRSSKKETAKVTPSVLALGWFPASRPSLQPPSYSRTLFLFVLSPTSVFTPRETAEQHRGKPQRKKWHDYYERRLWPDCRPRSKMRCYLCNSLSPLVAHPSSLLPPNRKAEDNKRTRLGPDSANKMMHELKLVGHCLSCRPIGSSAIASAWFRV